MNDRETIELDTDLDCACDTDTAPASGQAAPLDGEEDDADAGTGRSGTGRSGTGRRFVWTMPAEAAGQRVDKAIAAISGPLSGAPLSRARVQSLLEAGLVRSSGQVIGDAARRVKAGQVFEVLVPEAEPAEPVPQPIPLAIVYEDDDLIVINKPPGLVVHPAAGNADGTLVNALLFHCGNRLSGIGGVRRPGIVHRLDKDTSGLLVVAKGDAAHQGLAAQFADRTLRRTYLALVWGVPCPAEAEIAAPIGRDPHERKRMAVVAGGKPALTRYRVRRVYRGVSVALVECTLETGRTHQIRVHLAHRGHPLVGDAVYGRGTGRGSGERSPRAKAEGAIMADLAGFPRQALHAAALRFRHPRLECMMQFTADLPPDMHRLITSLPET